MPAFRSPFLRWGLGIFALALVACAIFLLVRQPLDLWRAPGVLQVSPAPGISDALPTSPITVTFSAPMDRAATQHAFVVSPEMQGRLEWADDRTLTYTPAKRFPLSARVTVTIAKSARSSLQRPLEHDYTWTFTILPPPAVLASDPVPQAHYSYANKSVDILFNRSMDHELFEAHLAITPSLENRHLIWNGNRLTVAGAFRPGQSYRLVLSTGALDEQYGLATDRAWTWSFVATRQYPFLSFTDPTGSVVFFVGQVGRVPIQFANISLITARLDPLDPNAFWKFPPTNRADAGLSRPIVWPFKVRSLDPHAALDQYSQFVLSLEPLPPGLYCLTVSAPETIPESRLLLVLQKK